MIKIKGLLAILITILTCIPVFSQIHAYSGETTPRFENKEIKYRAKLVGDISNYLQNFKIVNVSIGANQEICLLTVNNIPEPEVTNLAMFPPSKTNSLHNYKVVIFKGKNVEQIEILNETWNYHFVQPIDNDNVLLVSARSHYYKDGSYDKNGRVFNKQGVLVREFLLGDGIEKIKVSNQNNIWTSYFDEGVFGNYGWDNPVGSAGLREWDCNGNEIYKYNNKGDHFIADCYALNVKDDNDVWFYFYTPFELARKQNEEIRYYKTNISGSDGFIIYDKYILFRGGYKKHNNYFLYELGNDGLNLLGEVKLLDKHGESIETYCYDYRNSRLVLLSGTEIYLVDLKELLKDVL